MSSTNNRFKISWGTGLVIAIVLFMTATLGFVFFATTLDFDLVTKNHYEEAVDYQQVINRMEESDKLSVPVQFRYDGQQQQLAIAFPDEVEGLAKKGLLTLYRPDDAALDQQQSLSDIQQNKFSVQNLELSTGKWKVKLEWTADETAYYSETTLFVE